MTTPSPKGQVQIRLLFDSVGDFSDRGATTVRELLDTLSEQAPELLRSGKALIDQINQTPDLTDHDRDVLLDSAFSMIECNSKIQEQFELLNTILSFLLANQRSFAATRNARKRVKNSPKSRAMREIEIAWDAAGRPDTGEFAKDQAISYQLRGIGLTEKGIRAALKKHADKQ